MAHNRGASRGYTADSGAFLDSGSEYTLITGNNTAASLKKNNQKPNKPVAVFIIFNQRSNGG